MTTSKMMTIADSAADQSGAMTSAVLLWVAPQVAALCVGAFRVPLTAGYAVPAESAAAGVMVSVQVIAAAALFPVVLGGWQRLVMAVAMGWTFGLLAGFLATTATVQLIWTMGQVTTWLVALWAWAGVVQGPIRKLEPGRRRQTGRGAGLAVGVALLCTVGSAMLRYLRSEYQPAVGSGGGTGVWNFTPLLVSVRQLGSDGFLWTGWAVSGGLAVAGWVVGWGLRRRATDGG